MKHIMILHNQIAPYRLPLFDALNEQFFVEVLFCYERGVDRMWSIKEESCRFAYHILRSFSFGFRKRWIYVSPEVFLKIICKRPDVIILTLRPEMLITTFLAYLACRVANRPLCIWLAHHSKRQYKPNGILEIFVYGLYRRFEKYLVKHAKAVIAYGQMTKEYVVDHLEKEGDSVFVGTQVWPKNNTVIFHDFSKKPFKFLYIGYLVKGKRVEDLIDAFKKLTGDDIELIIVGDGPERDRLERLAAEDSRIRFTGYVEGEEKENLQKEAHVFVTPSGHDNLPNSMIEAMSYSLPIIATKECHCPEWLKENAFVFDAGDVNTLYQYLSLAYSYPEILPEMSRKSKELADTYTIPFAVRVFASAIDKILKSS